MSVPTRRTATWLLGLVCLLVYNANLRVIGAGDTWPARYLPLGIWRHGTLELDPIARLVAHGHPSRETWQKPPAPGTPGSVFCWAYWLIPTRDGHLASMYPIVTPVLLAPLYLPAAGYLHARGWPPWEVDWIAAVMEKLSASLLAATTVVVVYRLLRREAEGWALPLAVAFAFGTNTWMISSQALWQHGMGELLVALALLLVTSTLTPARCAALGAICVAMAANRPPDALLAAAMALYALWAARAAAAWLLVGAVVPLTLVIVYNLTLLGHLAGGYGSVEAPVGFFGHPLWAGLAGLLFSPMRGLLVFSPFLLLVPLGLVRRLRTPGTRVLAALLAAAVVAQLVLYAKADWRGGTSWGPRFLTDMLPILIWMLAPAPALLAMPARIALVGTMASAVAIQTIGAFWYTGLSDVVLYESTEGWMRKAWQVGNAPFVTELRRPRQRGDLACSVRGFLDGIGSAPRPTVGAPAPLIASGVRLQGWALACGRTPAELVVLADGLVIGHRREFAPARPDVVAATGSAAPSTWSVEADTRGLAPGEHVLQLAVRAEEKSDIRIVDESRAFVAPPLSSLAGRAAALLREHQAPAGYWLTTHTTEPRFANPRQEMNTFLTALLVDLLAPVAKHHGLGDVLEKARGHLAAQIERDGLVRYHGLPDGPGIGTLGCVITPDADDTALAWRIAPPASSDPRRASMLGVLKSYRDARGFYRTWLAPPERYQCLDPGRDPNPADVAIQMHVLLMLSEIDRVAARSLCQSLTATVSDESLWVYYARAPIVPLLRSADLRKIGCLLEIAPERLTGVPAQALWIDAARRLVAPQDALGSRALLRELGRDDFEEVRRRPPLLYHNDLTATVSRYYWSEDVGYALWLRLYQAHAEAERPSGTDQ